MSKVQYNLTRTENGSTITVFVDGRPFIADDQHPAFNNIVDGVLADDPTVVKLFDASEEAGRRFKRLSERLTASNGRVYFDGDELDNALTRQIVRRMRNKKGFKPLVAFLENVMTNDNKHSREQLFVWLSQWPDFAITTDGHFIAFKGIRSDLTSVTAGPAIVDGVPVNGHVPNKPGSVIEIARSKVNHDPSVGCSTGLHAGTYAYANSFGPVTVAVSINPRDVVSVPTDCDAQKLRVARYTVLDVVENDSAEEWDDGSPDDFDDEVVY